MPGSPKGDRAATKRVAILIDGGHLRKCAEKARIPYKPNFIKKMAARCANADEEVIRILYYDCAPFRGTVQLPVSGNDTEFKGDDVWLKDLARRRLFAVRRGVLKFRGWRPREIPIPGKKLTDADFAPIFEQKGVDMRIGLDIANLAANNIVVLADVDTDRRHLICRFAGHASCSFCYLHPKPKGALWSTVGPSH